jgi:hypothetical protein
MEFQSAHEAGLHGLDEDVVLALAAREGRMLVSHGRRTMPRHFDDFISNGTSAGLILISQNLPITDVADDLMLIGEASEAEEWFNRLDALPL